MRNLRTIIASALGVALAAGTVALATGPASASPAQPAAHARIHPCQTGSLSWAIGPAGEQFFTWGDTVLGTEDSPSGCEQVLTRIRTSGGHTYRSGLIRHVGTARATAKDGTHITKMWTEKQPNALPQFRKCRQDWPTFETTFHDCVG